MNKEKRIKNNERSKNKYLFIILYSLFIGGAEGAKLCQAKASVYNSYVQNASEWVWASGSGCKYSGSLYDEAAALDTGLNESNLSGACTGNSIFGVASCSGVYTASGDMFDNGIDLGNIKGVTTEAGGPITSGVVVCLCQMRGQKTNGAVTSVKGIWNMKSPFTNLASCQTSCSNLCGRHARNQFPHFLAGMMAVPTP